MYLRSGLGWLRGFPVESQPGGIEWILIGNESSLAAMRVRVERSHLQRMQMALTTLSSQHEADLEELFDNPFEWLASAALVLKSLKAVIHDGQPLDHYSPLATMPSLKSRRSHYQKFLTTWPRLTRLLNAVLWMGCLEPGLSASLLEPVLGHAETLDRFLAARTGTHGLIGAVQWVLLHAEGGGSAATALLHLLTDESLHTLPLYGLNSYVAHAVTTLQGIEPLLLLQKPKRKTRQEQPLPGRFGDEHPRPTCPLESIACKFLTRLVGLDQEKRQAELRLFGIIAEPSQFNEWKNFWKEFGPSVARAEKILSLSPEKILSAPPSHLSGLIAHLQNLQTQIPPTPPFATNWSEIWEVKHAPLDRYLDRFTEAIAIWEPLQETIPGESALVRGLVKLCNLYHFNDINLIKILEYLNAAVKKQQGNDSYRLALEKIAKNCAYGDLIEIGLDALDEADSPPSPKKFWNAYFSSLSFLSSDRIEPRGMANALKVAANAVIWFHCDLEKTDPFLRQFDFAAIKIIGWSSHLSLRVLIRLRLLGLSAEKSRDVLFGLDNGSHRAPDAIALDCFLDQVRRHHLENDLRDWGKDLTFEQLRRLARTAYDVSQLIKNLPYPRRSQPSPAASAWIGVYPAELAAPLRKLASLTFPGSDAPSGKKAAENILEATFPSKEKIDGEIQKLTAILAANTAGESESVGNKQALAKRLENLKKRLTHPAAVSAKRRANLAQKLEAAHAQLLYDFWLDHFDGMLQAEVCRMLGLATPPPWLEDSENRRLLAQILKLDEPSKRLGLKVLAKRCGPPPWDFAEEPENRAYLSGLQAQGIDIAPWVEPPSPQTVRGPGGQTLEISFARDPLEVFRMGEYFKTCLGFEGCNFYSTVTNFVDVNKHVLFAKNAKGTVIGRCLLALTERGWLQTFQAYSHDAAIEWDKIVAQIVQDLAAKMGTVITRSGEVPPLVAKSWYADPPCKLGEPASPFDNLEFIAMRLAEVSPEDFVECFEEQIRPIALPDFLKVWLLDGNVAALVFALGEEKMRLLYGPIESAFPKPDRAQHWWGIVLLARKAGLDDWAEKMFKKYVLATLAPEIKKNGFANDHAAELLLWMADHNPSLALRTLRQAYSPWSPNTGNDEDETNPTKRYLFARIHSKLGRNELASRMMKQQDQA